MDIERALLTKALSTKDDLPELVARGIDPDHFADEDLADLYDWAVDFMSKHASPPSMTIMREEFRDFQPLLTKDPLSWHDRAVRAPGQGADGRRVGARLPRRAGRSG